MVRRTVAYLFYFFISIGFLQAHDIPAEASAPMQKVSTLRETVKSLNQRSFAHQDDSWDSWTAYEYLSKGIERQSDPSPLQKRSAAFSLVLETKHASTSLITEQTTLDDSNYLADKKPNEVYVGSKLCRALTELGRTQFYCLIAAITDDYEEIVRRQDIIKTFMQDTAFTEELRKQLKECADAENLFLSTWDKDTFARSVEGWDLSYKKDDYFGFLNNSPTALLAKWGKTNFDKINHLGTTAIALTALPSLLIALLLKTDVGDVVFQRIFAESTRYKQNNFVTNYLWAQNNPYVQGAIAAVSITSALVWFSREREWIADGFMFEEVLQLKMCHVAKIFRTMRNMRPFLVAHPELIKLLPDLKAILELCEDPTTENKDIHDFLDLLDAGTFDKPSTSLLMNRGRVIAAYTKFHEIKDRLLPAIQALSLLDAYAGVAELMSESKDKMCFVELEKSDTIHLKMSDFWNPLLSPAIAVPNTLELGTPGASQNCIITGPNAGGKSTLIKALAINTLLAQSLGIAAARSCTLTPFAMIATYLNITDDIGKGDSLYRAEVLRAQELINAVEALKPGQFALLFFDEMFNGTNPTEAAASAYSVSKYLGTLKNCITVLATHFALPTRLDEDPETGYKNYKVSVTVKHEKDAETGVVKTSMTYPFKLEEGISHQHIAIDILKSEGYSSKIFEEAEKMISTGKA